MKIEITDDLVMSVAREQYARCNVGVLDDQKEYVRVGWVVGAGEILEDFNCVVDIFDRINMYCTVREPGCWDVEEYYKE